MMELENAVDYFPYIRHELNQEKLLKAKMWRNVIGSLFDEANMTDAGDQVTIRGDENVQLFRNVTINGVREQRKIAHAPFSVGAIVPRHRSLYDYGIGMPVHNRLINSEVMLLAGSNLFVAAYDTMLRHYGAMMFLRQDTVLKRKGYPRAFLSIERYLQEVFPAYLNAQMFEGVGASKLKRDIIVYPGHEKNPVTKKRSGGRSKTGRLRDLSPLIFETFRNLARDNTTRLYITPVNVSFSKYPDATFIAHPTKHRGFGFIEGLRYMHEQIFVDTAYPRYAHAHPEAKLDVIVNYGKPEHYRGENLRSFRDIFNYTKALKEKIGRLESIFPSTLLFRAMGDHVERSFSDLENSAKRLYDHYGQSGINVTKISVGPGKMRPIREMAEEMTESLNSNPPYRIFGSQTKEFVACRAGRFTTRDKKLQDWYANSIRHLDPETPA